MSSPDDECCACANISSMRCSIMRPLLSPALPVFVIECSSHSLFRDGAAYFCPLRFCTMTSPVLFHLPMDGFQADILLCHCVHTSPLPPSLLLSCHFAGSKRKGCSESYTSAFPATSRVHLRNEVRWHTSPGWTSFAIPRSGSLNILTDGSMLSRDKNQPGSATMSHALDVKTARNPVACFQ